MEDFLFKRIAEAKRILGLGEPKTQADKDIDYWIREGVAIWAIE